MKIVLIGIQGSGKSTQGNLLSEKLGVPYLSTGHIFRKMAKEQTEIGRYIKEVMNAGYLIPDDKTLKIVAEYLSRPEYEKGYILDGFPRTIAQAESFENGIDKVLYLEVSDKESHARIAGRHADGATRADDTDSAINRRIALFHKFTKPVLAYYGKKDILATFNGEESINDIHENIMREFDKK
jgi:adenylate kinase